MQGLDVYFRSLRFNDKFHLGLGDVRLTKAMQDEVCEYAAQQSVQLTALRRWLAVSIFINVILLAVVLFTIGGN
jgi:hypothetical protein